METIKTLFLGSNWESVTTLEALYNDSRFEIVGVVTKIDSPVGRKMFITPTPVKEFATKHNIPVFHTEKSAENYQKVLDEAKPELLVVKSFGEIIPEFFLETPKYKAINVHFSLLPKYRGAVPIQKAILDGEKTTGISIVKMVKALDAGEVLEMFEVAILPTDTNQSLRERLVELAAQKLPDILVRWCAGKIKAIPQDESKATFCWQKDIAKENAEVNWETMEAEYIERMIRAFIPWPVVWTTYKEKRLKLFSSQVINTSEIEELNSGETLKPGQFYAKHERLFIGTKSPSQLLQILELQLEGGKLMSAAEFIRGQNL
ncbi:MAG: methionyl-tRNA formyltransferase [Candidatus Dojkabacteria bacterium]